MSRQTRAEFGEVTESSFDSAKARIKTCGR
jgi:hypothetical protein